MCVYQIHVRLPSNMSIWFLHSSVVPVKNLISNCFSGWITYAGVKTSFREQFSSLGHPDMICTHGVFVLFLLLWLNTQQGAIAERKGLLCLWFYEMWTIMEGDSWWQTALCGKKYAAWTLLIMVDRRQIINRGWDQAIKHHGLPITNLLFQ